MKNSTFKGAGKPLARSKPMSRGTATLTTSKPLARGDSQLKRVTSLKASGQPLRARKPAKDKPKRAARNAGAVDYLALCRGQDCYLLVPGVLHHPRATVVPAHSNQAIHGKGMALKALDAYTVPGCAECHREIDQGNRFTKTEKFALWDAAYARWEPVRARLIAANPPKSAT
jgi:hypothetical protein